MNRKLIKAFCLMMAVASGSAVAAPAGGERTASAVMHVRVVVRAYLGMRMLSAPASVAVTRDDVARGFVDVAQPIGVVVVTNDQVGFQLTVTNVGTAVRYAELTRDDESLRVAPQATVSSVVQGVGLREQRLAWKVRLYLASGANPGELDWPLQFSVGL